MSSTDNFRAVFDELQSSHRAGRLAHAYLLVGTVRTQGLLLSHALLKLLFCLERDAPCGVCSACLQVEERTHPDIGWVEPRSKSRQIKVAEVRELNLRMAQTAYLGGWKAGVVIDADRMTENASNAFLKTLEEPPGQSLLLLLSASPQGLLPTILSRCQRVSLSGTGDDQPAPWRDVLRGVLREGPPPTPLAVHRQAARLKGLLDKLRAGIEEEEKEALKTDEQETNPTSEEADKKVRDARIQARLLGIRADMMREMLFWHRDVLVSALGSGDEILHCREDAPVIRQQAKQVGPARALDNVRAVEGMIRRLERSMPAMMVFESGLSQQMAPQGK